MSKRQKDTNGINENVNDNKTKDEQCSSFSFLDKMGSGWNGLMQ